MKILMSSIVDLKNSQHNRPHEFVEYLSKNHDLTIVSINDCWKQRHGNTKKSSSVYNGIFDRVEYHYLTKRNISPVLQEIFYRKKVEELSKDEFDVHLNYNSLITGFRFSKKIKTVFDIADDLPAMIYGSPQIPSFLKLIGCKVGDMFLYKNLKNASQITLTNDHFLDKYNLPPSKVKTIPNGVNINKFRYFPDAREKKGWNGFIIGYVGVLREWVDFEPLFKALKNLDERFKLVVLGKEGFYKKNVALANSYGISDRVMFLGNIPYSQVPEYISAMDICVIPFKSNDITKSALPLKLFEYMACEKPIITTKTPVIEENFDGLVLTASNEQEYLNQIRFLHENEDIRIKMGKKGRELVEKCYNWETIVKNLEITLKSVVE